MPAGLPYFAWIGAGETTFGPEHLRWDEQIFSFTLSQDEGDPASLTIVVRRPRNASGDPIGLLGPGRAIWCWFALDCGPALIKFRGRLVGVPTSLFEELVTLEFVARPGDVVAQKEAVANSLRVLPYYDVAVIDSARRTDPDVVLEGYTKIWHFDRETHIVSVSDEISGEDGLVEFDGTTDSGKVLFDGLGLSLTSGPLARVDVAAEYTWTQQGYGIVDLTNYLVSNWPGASNGQIGSYTMSASDWPSTGSSIGDGWTVASASAHDVYDFTVHTATQNVSVSIPGMPYFPMEWGPRDYSYSDTVSYLVSSPPTINAGDVVINAEYKIDTPMPQGPLELDIPGGRYPSSDSRNVTYERTLLAMQAIRPTLVAAWTAGRECTERVSFSLFADIQPILTDPEDGEALRIDDIRSVNLSEMIDGALPIGDVRRRSYIATERGNRSLEHLIVLARAHLMKRARVVEIAFAPKLARMPEITLRKNAVLTEPRVGVALGKIIGYSVSLDGSDGRIKCEVRIGCAIGRGGSAATFAGSPTYATIDYCGVDYQQFADRVIAIDTLDTSVAYQPPAAAPNDDGLELTGALSAEEVVDQPLVVVFGPDEQAARLRQIVAPWMQMGGQNRYGSEVAGAKNDALDAALQEVETRATFKLKSMTREFISDYQIQVTDLKIPTGYNLEAT